MDEDMEEFVMEQLVSSAEIDLDYEFDASRFYDFTLPETDMEAREIERWFESAKSYPPSPFVLKLKWGNDLVVESTNTSAQFRNDENMDHARNVSDCCMGSEVSATDEVNRGLVFYQMAEAGPKAKTKSPVKSTLVRSSTLMKPTASHLAKQNTPREVHSTRFLRRFQKKLVHVDGKSSGTSWVIDSQATKRQKLEAGYLQKVAHLKHQPPLLHKLPKKVGTIETIDVNSVHTRPQVTIPREPNLATARRAQRHRSKTSTESDGHVKSNGHTFKARPLNRKILETPLPLYKRSIPRLRDFKVFHLKTSERAMQHKSNNAGNLYNSNSLSHSETTEGKSLNSTEALKQESCKTVNKFKAFPLSRKENLMSSKISSKKLPSQGNSTFQLVRCFQTSHQLNYLVSNCQLSLSSDTQHNGKSQSKMHLPTKRIRLVLSIKHMREWVGRKLYQRGSYRSVPEIGPHYVNRPT
ncbi:protein TPX2-like isoform X3 [Carya illinoinensis]|uniref:protein TPX2-like isoform X3 n=1 Tax=Carya illinoinensis TaxID=32201 RepID=UPI001C7191C3|nr:protein TPX2-like isoform X3 [Carya illinoinensis]